MKKEYQKVGDNLVITIPLKTQRFNPYKEMAGRNGYVGEMDNIIGFYENEYSNGLVYRIDMEYKGKDDQFTDYFYKLNGSLKEFEEMIKELGVGVIYLCPENKRK